MNRPQEMARVAEALGTWKAAGKAVVAIHRAIAEGGTPTEEERGYFDALVRLFVDASRGAKKVGSRGVSLSSGSAQEYSAFLDVSGAVRAVPAGEGGGDLGRTIKRLREAAELFSRGEIPAEGDALLLRNVLRIIAAYNARQTSEFFFAPVPALR